MVHVELVAALMELDHSYILPHEQSLNEAEMICNTVWASAEAHLIHSGAPDSLLAQAVSYTLYVDLRTATTPSRGYLTPCGMIKGAPPAIDKLHRFYTSAFVTNPKKKRKKLIKQGLRARAEAGRLLGFHSPCTSTYRVLLSGNRLVHSINDTFDDGNFREGTVSRAPARCANSVDVPIPMAVPSVQSEEALDQVRSPGVADAAIASDFRMPFVQIEHFDDAALSPLPEYFDPSDDGWKTRGGTPQDRPRPPCIFLCSVEDSMMNVETSPVEADLSLSEALTLFVNTQSKVGHGAILEASRFLAMSATKDMS